MTTSTTTASPTTSKGGPRPKRVPQRTCVGCRTTHAKGGFVRVVRTPGGAVVVDESGKANGRGAYLCEKRSCWDEALKRDRLANALHISITQQDAEALRQYAARFASEGSNG